VADEEGGGLVCPVAAFAVVNGDHAKRDVGVDLLVFGIRIESTQNGWIRSEK